MGWFGIVFLGLVIGLAGWWLHPLRRSGAKRAGRFWLALAAAVLGAVVAKMLGNVTGAFHDGDSLEWLTCALVALVAVSVAVGLAARR
ncbi:hypothetical protein [Burkholderiaceae bacterium]|jgi:hypothetical protein|nr:hypothetical protein [Pseudomonadota bacterium]